MKEAFAGNWSPEFVRDYRITDSSSYPLTGRLHEMSFDSECIRQCLYRLFDARWLYYQQGFTSQPRGR